MNMGFIGNSSISDKHTTNHLTDVGNIKNTDDYMSTVLVTIWIGLMILGSFLLYHIHFKVLPRE